MSKLLKLSGFAVVTAAFLHAQWPDAEKAVTIRPLLDRSEDLVSSSIRQERDKLFRYGNAPLLGPPGALGPAEPSLPPPPPPGVIVHLKEMPELPSTMSDRVVVGEITNIQPFVTPDQNGLYTEYSVRILEEIKRGPADQRNSLVFIRIGGAARMTDGRIVELQRKGEGGDPVVGKRYLIFLQEKPRAEAYFALKLWEIEDEQLRAVYPDDLARVSRRESIYNGKSYLAAVADIRSLEGK